MSNLDDDGFRMLKNHDAYCREFSRKFKESENKWLERQSAIGRERQLAKLLIENLKIIAKVSELRKAIVNLYRDNPLAGGEVCCDINRLTRSNNYE